MRRFVMAIAGLVACVLVASCSLNNEQRGDASPPALRLPAIHGAIGARGGFVSELVRRVPPNAGQVASVRADVGGLADAAKRRGHNRRDPNIAADGRGDRAIASADRRVVG